MEYISPYNNFQHYSYSQVLISLENALNPSQWCRVAFSLTIWWFQTVIWTSRKASQVRVTDKITSIDTTYTLWISERNVCERCCHSLQTKIVYYDLKLGWEPDNLQTPCL